MMTTNKTARIAIIGAGPGGLTLARILATRGITSTIFELDEYPLARPQGGSLDLHAESGQRAMREAGLEAQFKALARYDDQGDAIYDHLGILHFDHTEAADNDRPEIDRTQLRSILLDSLPQDMIRWGIKVTAIEPISNGRYRVVSEAGVLGDFDLVVGADGAWSKVRPLVSKATPNYTGILCIELCIDDVDTQHPSLAAIIPNGKISAVGDNRGFIAQRSSNGHVRVYLIFRVPEEETRKGIVDLSSPARARAELKTLLSGWAPSMLAFIDAGNDTITSRPIVALPIGHQWKHRPGVTLLGDAAHVMAPFSGEGVNMAMLDALELALRLAANSDWSEAVAGYEEHMFTRAAEAAAGANQAASTWPQQVLDFIEEGSSDQGSMQSPASSTVSQLVDISTIKEIFETRIAEKTRDAAVRKKVKAVYRFDVSGLDGGSWIVDFREATFGVRQSDEACQCTVTTTDDNFRAMLAGEFTPRMGFMRGKLKIKGDMSLAMKISHVLEV